MNKQKMIEYIQNELDEAEADSKEMAQLYPDQEYKSMPDWSRGRATGIRRALFAIKTLLEDTNEDRSR